MIKSVLGGSCFFIEISLLSLKKLFLAGFLIYFYRLKKYFFLKFSLTEWGSIDGNSPLF
jgi:hypothetical protein